MPNAPYPLSDDLVPPFLELLQRMRVVCHGDLDKNLILLAIAERSVRHPELREITEARRLAGEIPIFPNLGVNARSIADSSGIPRETVRRKIAELISAGWISQVGRNLHYTRQGYQALTPAREGLAQLAIQFIGIVERHGSDAG